MSGLYHDRPTVADIRALKGKRQLTMLYVDTPDEAAAAATAGIDMLSIIDPVWTLEMREAAGDCFVQVGLLYGELVTAEDYQRAAHRVVGSAAIASIVPPISTPSLSSRQTGSRW